MAPDGSLPHTQQPATCPCPGPDRSSPCPHPTSLRSILILSFPQVAPLKSCMHLSSPVYVLYVLPISVLLIWSPEWYLVKSIEHKGPCFVVFSTPLLPRLCYCVCVCVCVCTRGLACGFARVTLVIQYAKRMRRIVLSSVTCPAPEYKMCVLIFSTSFAFKISHYKKNSTKYRHKCESFFM